MGEGRWARDQACFQSSGCADTFLVEGALNCTVVTTALLESGDNGILFRLRESLEEALQRL
jgi:hypothetical protein